MKVIIISGTPGTGKTALAERLAKQLGFKKINLKPVIKEIEESYDKKKQCYVVDIKRLNKKIIEIINSEKKSNKIKEKIKTEQKRIRKENKKTTGMIISSHLIHNLPKRYADLCIITRCSDLKKLKRRLVALKYPKRKVEENLECEIFDICLEEAKKKGHKLLVVDACQKKDEKKFVGKVEKFL